MIFNIHAYGQEGVEDIFLFQGVYYFSDCSNIWLNGVKQPLGKGAVLSSADQIEQARSQKEKKQNTGHNTRERQN